MAKKVLLMIIDALTPSVFIPAMERGDLPTFKALADHGQVTDECCSVFPSITHACLSSIATGCYPLEHGVLGSFWYEKDSEDVAYYGAQFWMVLHQGVDKFLEDLLFKLNQTRLKQDTIFEKVERAGLKAACLNHLVYRGIHETKVHEPFLLKMVPGVSTTKALRGPTTFLLGDFIPLRIDGEEISIPGGPQNRFGMDDGATLAGLEALADRGGLPDFTLAYFPDNDVTSHETGPRDAEPVLETLDKGLAKVIEKLGGMDRFLAEHTVIVHGDHAQTDVREGKYIGGVDLKRLLKEFKLIQPGEVLDEPHELLVAPNLRTVFIYMSEPDRRTRDQVAFRLLSDIRVDQVIWQAEVFKEGERGFVVLTADRGHLHFWPGADGPNTAVDDYGCAWSWRGSLGPVDARVEGGEIVWGDYPNAFERIACGIGPLHAGHLWATVCPGYSFRVPHVNPHDGGGSHASLHRGDSYTALLVAGLPEGMNLPDHPRIVDTSDLILEVLGLKANEALQPRYREVASAVSG